MKQVASDVFEQALELGQTIKKSVAQDLIKGIPQTAKQQVVGGSGHLPAGQVGQSAVSSERQVENKINKTSDPVTGKPTPSKKALTQLSDAANRLQMTKLQKIRGELEKQRLKKADSGKGLAASEEHIGPNVKVQEKKLDPGAVARTLKQSQSTGEFKGSVGG